MNRFLLLALTAGILFPNAAIANEAQKMKAIRLVADKYDKQLKKHLEGTGANPAYMAWVRDDSKVSIKAGTHQPTTFSTLEWFEVDVCKRKVELMDYRNLRTKE